MTLEQARKVMWLRSHCRPIGELLDEGYLNDARLQWAAEHAYNPLLKQAARILLDGRKESPAEPTHSKPTPIALPKTADEAVPVGLTIEQARVTSWPFPPDKGQSMGALSETRRLSLKDLGYAVENAWDERVRQAATALMLVRLRQAVKEPTPSAGFVQVVSGGRSYAERSQDVLTLVQGAIGGAALAFAASAMGWAFLNQLSKPQSQPRLAVLSTPSGKLAMVILAILLVLAGGVGCLIAFALDRIVDKIEQQKELFRQGQQGEDRAVEVICQVLDGNWTLFRNIALPGRNPADLDLVLLGPPGVWVLEVKAFNGTYRNMGENWEYRAGRRWRRTQKSPSRQAQNNAVRLANFLRADGINQWVTSAVIWANRETALHVENPAVAVWPLDRLPDELGNVWQSESLPEARRQQIAEKLTRLCQPRTQ